MIKNIASRSVSVLYSLYPDYSEIASAISSLPYDMDTLEPQSTNSMKTIFKETVCVKLGIISAILSAAVAEECTCLYETLIPHVKDSISNKDSPKEPSPPKEQPKEPISDKKEIKSAQLPPTKTTISTKFLNKEQTPKKHVIRPFNYYWD